MQLGHPVTGGGEVDVIHGITVHDPYRWLENRQHSGTEEWLEQQRRGMSDYLGQCEGVGPLRERVMEILNRERLDQPAVAGGRLFYRRRSKDGQQAQIYTRTTTEERLLVDPSSRGPFFSVGMHAVAADGSMLAFETRLGGGDGVEIHFMDICRNEVLPEYLASGRPRGLAFLPCNRGVYYSHDLRDNAASHVVSRHLFGEPLERDMPILSFPRTPRSRLVLCTDQDNLGAFHIFDSGQRLAATLYLASRADDTCWRTVFNERSATCVPTLRNGHIFLETYDSTPGGSIVELDPRGRIRRVVVPEEERRIHQVSIRNHYIYVLYLEGLKMSLHLWSIAGKYLGPLETPDEGTIRLVPSYLTTDDTLFYEFESCSLAPTIFRYSPDSRTSTIWHTPTRSSRHLSRCESRLFSYQAKDGVRIPMTTLMRETRKYLSNRAVLMTSYGGFGVSQTPKYSPLIEIMLDLNVVIAIPHIRGGGEFGEEWHTAGRKRQRQVSFDDFISAAEWLCNRGITAPRKLGIYGGSNAGLLVAAVMTQRPDLMYAVLCIAPLLDMVRYERFDRAARWKDEYGTVEDADDFFSLYRFSPYHQVLDGVNYPSTLFVSGDQDDRCNPAHVRKMTARLQNRSSQANPILLDYSKERGHAAAMPLSFRVEALTLRLAFLCRELNVTVPREKEQ
jgi:prolyl oligopeptidase